jgi:hypothetical protein
MCSKNDFDVEATAQHCDIIECSDIDDCCGDRPTEAPSKCNGRSSICETPNVPGCNTTTCEADGECNGGTCGSGQCQNTFGSCGEDSECTDECVAGFCSLSLFACIDEADCYGADTCANRFCDCDNPDFDPFDPICTDEDCEDICTLKCDDERCLEDTTCEENVDCFAFGRSLCDDGVCVDCVEDDDCDTDGDEECVSGTCIRPCTENEECPLFHECDEGECIERGCTSDRECILAVGAGVVGGEDARLSECLPSDFDPDINTCKVPCENDGACASELQICEAGYCKFIGCEEDEECRAFFGLANAIVNESMPYVPKAVCRE